MLFRSSVGETRLLGGLLLAVGALIAIMPIMGFRVAVPTAGFAPPAAPGADRIRVLSLNAQGGAIVKLRLAGILERYAPSIVAMQECGDELAAVAAQQRGWYTARYEGLCTMSRWPIEFADTMPRAAKHHAEITGVFPGKSASLGAAPSGPKSMGSTPTPP